MKHSILFVDDEKSILSSMTRLFRKEDYNILTASSGEEGLKILEENEISLVVSDHMMPGMRGVDFLSKAKELSPDTIRIMLTGYADLEATMAAINKGEVHRFITKPWNDKELLFTVKQSLDYRTLLLENVILTKAVRKQRATLKNLEEQYPGITDVKKDEYGAVIIEDLLFS